MHIPLYIHCAFYFRIISDGIDFALCFLVRLFAYTGANVSSTFSCVSSFVTAASPHYLDLLSHVFSAYGVIIMWSMWLYISVSVIFGDVPSVFRWMCPLPLVLSARVGIILVTGFLVLVGYPPECSSDVYSSYSYIIST